MKSIDGNNFKINGAMESPMNLDYDIMGFHKKRTITKGELLSVEYYRNFDGTTYSDLVVKEERVYTRNAMGLVMYRSMIISWYFEDGTVGEVKNTTKFYSPQESIDEGMNRRGNMIADGKLYILGTVGLANGQDFLVSLTGEVNLFVNGATQPLRDAITASTKTYITQTMKDTLQVIFTF